MAKFSVKVWRAMKAITQKELEEKAGIFQSVLSKIEHGTQEPTDEQKAKIAEVLGVKPNEISWKES